MGHAHEAAKIGGVGTSDHPDWALRFNAAVLTVS